MKLLSLTFQFRMRVERWAAMSAYTPAEAPASTIMDIDVHNEGNKPVGFAKRQIVVNGST